MESVFIVCLTAGIIIALSTVETNNSFKLKRNVKYIGITMLLFIAWALYKYFQTKIRLYSIIDIPMLILFIISANSLKEKLSTTITKEWYKAYSYDTKAPTNQEIIDMVSVITIGDNELTFNGNVYSNYKNIIIDYNNNVNFEIYEYNMPLIQEYIIFSVGLLYLSISSVKQINIVVGALAILCAVVHRISIKLINNKLRLFFTIIYNICLVSVLSLCILMIFNKV